MKHFFPALRMMVLMTVLLGIIYPLLVTGIAKTLFPHQAAGSLIARDGRILGSSLIAQKFEKPEYFWPRPSAVDYNPLSSGGSNLGPISLDLLKAVEERRSKLKSAHPSETSEPPQDLLFASGSGLDPHLSLASAQYQIQRVAKARNWPNEKVQKLVDQAVVARQWGFFGEDMVNVLQLNLALDQAQVATGSDAK